jgi:hypothetical protein
VPCRSDARFGFRAELFFPNDRTARLPVVIEISEPPEDISSYAITVVNAFKSDANLVDGMYTVRLMEPDTRLVYLERTFILRNCEARFVAAPISKLSAATSQNLPSNKGLQLTTDSWAFLNSVAFWRRDSVAWR